MIAADTIYVAGCGHLSVGILSNTLGYPYLSQHSACCRCGHKYDYCSGTNPGWRCFSHRPEGGV